MSRLPRDGEDLSLVTALEQFEVCCGSPFAYVARRRYGGGDGDAAPLQHKDDAMIEQPRLATGSFAEMLVDESPDALSALSLEGEVLSWNRGAEMLFGFTPLEAVGRALDQLIVPDDLKEHAGAALRETVNGEATVFETTRRRKDGSTVHVDVWMRRVTTAGV